MRRVTMLASILGITLIGLVLVGPARADSFSIGVQTNSVNLGIHIGPTPPPLVVVPAPVVVVPSAPPGPPPPVVYTAPSLPYNYFVYQNSYYLNHEDRWFRGRHYNGPWTVIGIAQVPRPVLAVPVEQYQVRPAHWEHHGRPPWARERERERHEAHGHGHGHDKGRD